MKGEVVPDLSREREAVEAEVAVFSEALLADRRGC